MEKIIQDRSIRNEANYQKLLEVLAELERRQDSKFSGLINELRGQLEETVNVKNAALEKTTSQSHQKVLDLLLQLESRIDGRNVELVRDLMQEIEKV